MQTDDITYRLSRLADDLAAFKATDPCPWTLGATFNALLDAAKEAARDDPVLAAYTPVEESGTGRMVAGVNCGALRAMAQQVVAALPSQLPRVA
jgi:hypothetical protein